MVPEEDDGPPDLLADVPCGPPLVWSALTAINEPLPNKSVEASVIVAINLLSFFITPSGVSFSLEQKLVYEHDGFIQLQVKCALSEIMPFVFCEQIPDRCARFLYRVDYLVCFAGSHTGIVFALNDHQRLPYVLRIREWRNAIQVRAHLGISFIPVFFAPMIA